ncbi:hypothetical protein BaRGS_00007473 [Batillaria attramentaria]|uniref:EGF-like domain-containing protein n=1 Tax=Batillaria attramentaria TaxID=370345 RepID=A0ABD0LQQ7_9CAEN
MSTEQLYRQVCLSVGSTTMRDWCHSGPCHNGATCSNTDSGFQCQCAPGFRGEQCDQGHAPINPASAGLFFPCFPALAFLFVFECHLPPPPPPVPQCRTGNSGILGETAGSTTMRDWCHSDPCHNGATCSNEDSGFHCQCAPGFQGEQCDQGHPPTTPATTAVDSTTMRNWCHSSPCHNGATCTNTDSGFQCQCAPGFRGITKGTQASQTVRQTTTSNQPSPGNPTADTNNLGGSSAVNGTRYVVVEKEVGCSVILCYIIIPLLSILCFVILAAFIAICFYYRMERQKSHELARVNPETPKVRRAFVAHR